MALNDLKDVFIGIDEHGIIKKWNAAVEVISGISKEETIGKNADQFFSPGVFKKTIFEHHFEVTDNWVEIITSHSADGITASFRNIEHWKETDLEINEFQMLAFDLFNFTPVPLWVYDTSTLKIIAANRAAINDYGYTHEEILSCTIKVLWPPSELEIMEEQMNTKVKNRSINEGNFKFIKKSGEIIDVSVKSRPLNSWGENIRIVKASDITYHKFLSDIEKLERNILELNSRGMTTSIELLQAYTLGIESLIPGMKCAVMKIKNNRIYNWASPSLPQFFKDYIEGIEIGINAGSCGTAAFLKQRIIAQDIATDPRWADFREVALKANLAASWSQPIISSEGKVLATFAMYYSVQKKPDATEISLIERASSLLTVILEARRNTHLLKDATLLMSQGQELAHFGNWSWNIQKDVVTWSDTLYQIYGLKKGEFDATFEGYQRLLHEDDRERIVAIIQSVFETTADTQFEERIIRPTGEIRHLKSWAKLKFDENGAPLKMIGACLDITESKKVELELEASIARYSDLFHLSPQPMWVYDVDSLQFLDVNDAAIRQYGYSKQEFLDLTIKDIRPEEDLDFINDVMRNRVKKGFFHAIPSRHRKKSGELILVDTKANSIIYNGREARIVLAIDNTEQIRTEEALKLSERRFKSLIQEGADIIVILDPLGNYIYASPAAEKALSLERNDLIGRNMREFVHPDDLEIYLKEFASLSTQHQVEFKPYRLIGAHGKILWRESIMTNLTEDPAIGGIVVNARDVTQQMENQIRTKELLERYNTVSKATSDTIWDLNIDTGTVIWSNGLSEVFGHKSLIGTYQWWYEHVHPDDITGITDIVENHVNNKEPRWTCEYRFKCGDGSYKSVLDRGFLLFDENGKLMKMIGAMQDITEHVKYTEDIEHRNERLREIAWQQAHLVRAPVARILGLLQLAEHEETKPAELKEYLDLIKRSAMEMDGVIKDIVAKAQDEKRGL